MRNNAQKLKIEKVLDSMHLEPINAHSLENAKTRVWNKLSHSIDKTEHKNIMSNNEQIAAKGTFWDKYHKSLLSFGIVTLVVASTVGTTTYLTLKDRKNNQTTQTTQSDDKTASIDNLKILAAQRFEALTGITYDEYQVVAANAKNIEKNSAEKSSFQSPTSVGSTARTDTALAQVAPTLNPEKVRELALKAEKNEIKVYYTESEIRLSDPEKYKGNPQTIGFMLPIGNFGVRSDVDYGKPFVSKSWVGNNYSKEVISQDGKVVSMYIYTPDFDLNFRGGKYAVRSNHDNAGHYFNGVLGAEDQNPDLQFIKYILSENSNIKKIGTKVVDGVTLTIYEDNMLADMVSVGIGDSVKSEGSQLKIRYYVDENKLQVKIVENYISDVLTSTITKKHFAEFSDESAKKTVSDYSEINSVEVKTINRDLATPIQFEEEKLVNFIKKYPTVYIPGDLINAPYDTTTFLKQQENDPYTKLVNTKDFDPGFDQSIYDSFSKIEGAPVAGYSQSRVYYNISKTETIRFNTTIPNDQNRKVDQVPVVIDIDGIKVSATLYTEKFEYKDVPETLSGAELRLMPASSENYVLVFNYKGFWYEISEFRSDKSTGAEFLKSPIKFSLLNEADARAMDSQNQIRRDAIVELDYGVSLNDISKDIRLLPGDQSQTLKLVAVFAAKSKADAKNKPCEQFADTLNNQCIISKFGGFTIDFSKKFDENAAIEPAAPLGDYNYFQYIVINAPLSQVQPMLDKIKTNGTYVTNDPYTKPYIREINGKTVMLIGSLNDANANQVLNNVKLDNGFEILEKQLEESKKPIYGIPVDMQGAEVIAR